MPGWRVVSSTPNGAMLAAAAAGPNDLYGFGIGSMPAFNADGSPLAVRFGGHRWTAEQLPAGLAEGGIGCAGATSPANVWAFNGSSPGGFPVDEAALRHGGSGWLDTGNFGNSAAHITGCSVISPGNVWAFGNYEPVTPFFGTWHFSGTGWTEVSTPGFTLAGASPDPAGDLWGLGHGRRRQRGRRRSVERPQLGPERGL